MKIAYPVCKSVLCAVVAAGFLVTTHMAVAAPEKAGTPPRMGAGESGMTDWLADKIGLTDEQKAKVSVLTASQREAMEKTRQELSEKHHKMQDAVEAGDETAAVAAATEIGTAMGNGAVQRIKLKKQIDALLTPEQKAKSEDIRKEQKERMNRMREIISTRMKERAENAAAGKKDEAAKNGPLLQPIPAQPVTGKPVDVKK